MSVAQADRAIVERIVRAEADHMGVHFADVIAMSRRPRETRARHFAMVRILQETGWSAGRLARVWGCDAPLIRQIRRLERGNPYDANTVQRLVSRYGHARTEQIVRGDCPNTNADIAAWRRLCALGAAA